MNYFEMYIDHVNEKNEPVKPPAIYLLPGLVDVHTSTVPTEEEQNECKQTYNDYLELFRKHKTHMMDENLTEEDRIRAGNYAKDWAEKLHELLLKIGRYTTHEMMEGFTLYDGE